MENKMYDENIEKNLVKKNHDIIVKNINDIYGFNVNGVEIDEDLIFWDKSSPDTLLCIFYYNEDSYGVSIKFDKDDMPIEFKASKLEM